MFAWLGKELDGVFLAALLTVIGYSINDTVVVFDRIREQRRARSREPLVTVANDACLQTIPRTVNTGLGALFILVALYVLGGETLTDFALALLVGIVVGTYSSVFAAAPLAVLLEGWKPAPGTAAPTRALQPTASRRQPVTASAPESIQPAKENKVSIVPAVPVRDRAGPPRPRKRKGKKGGKRRGSRFPRRERAA